MAVAFSSAAATPSVVGAGAYACQGVTPCSPAWQPTQRSSSSSSASRGACDARSCKQAERPTGAALETLALATSGFAGCAAGWGGSRQRRQRRFVCQRLVNLRRPGWPGATARHASASQKERSIWDELGEEDDDDDDDDDSLLGGLVGKRGATPQSSKSSTPASAGARSAGKFANFKKGADFSEAKRFASTRWIAVAPWCEDVKPKRVFAASDSTGNVASRLAQNVFRQFGPSEKCDVQVMPGVRDADDVQAVIVEASKQAPPGALAIEEAGGFLLYTIASKELSELTERLAHEQGVPCANALEPVLRAMESHFDMDRTQTITLEDRLQSFESESKTVFAVSDSTGETAFDIARAALQQFPGSGVDNVTVCNSVHSLEEVNQIVGEAKAEDSIIIFSFASPGMSRFIRQQCERADVTYADIYQPLVLAFERYLNYPPLGVPGGHDLNEDADFFDKWERRELWRQVTEEQKDE